MTILKKKNKKSKLPIIFTILIIGGLIGSYWIFPGYKEFIDSAVNILSSGDKDRISNWVQQFGFWGPLTIIFFMIAQMFLLVINVVALMVVAVLAYGPIWGSLIAVGGIVIASTLGYIIGYFLGDAAVDKLIGQKSNRKIQDKVNKYGVWAIIVARISPFLSNDAISFVAGLAKMGYLKFMGATFAGILPLTILIAFLGEDFERLKTGLIWISAISIGALIIYVIYDWKFKKKDKSS